MAVTIPMGTLTQKMACQLTLWSRNPPRVGPKTGASTIGTPMALITLGRFTGPAAFTRIVIPVGTSIPPPRPWRARNAMSSGDEDARPQSAEPAVNRMSACM